MFSVSSIRVVWGGLLCSLATVLSGAGAGLALTKERALPVLHERLVPSLPEVDLTVLPLTALLAQLPLAGGADGLLLVCSDRWQSVLRLSFVKAYDPYLLLYYEGKTPEQGWPRFSRVEAFAPYYINVSYRAHPDFKGVTPEGMISATQVVEIRAIEVARHYAPFYEGSLAKLTAEAVEGRKLFIQECNNCHQGPGGVGGNTSQRPLLLLQTHATLNAEYFRKLVRRPKDFFPDTVMPPHEHYGEETFRPLISFLKESQALMNPESAQTPSPAVATGDAVASIRPQHEKINTQRTLLSPSEIETALKRLPGWRVENGTLKKLFVRKNFVEAIAFISALVPECERIDHHPEIVTVYNKVNIGLTTYDAGNRVSTFDVLLAERFDAVAAR